LFRQISSILKWRPRFFSETALSKALKPFLTNARGRDVPASTGKLASGDEEFIHDIQEALLAQSPQRSLAVLYLIGIILIVGLIWAAFARVEEVTQGSAKVIPASREQVIQSLEGGILTELLVREGQTVNAGDVLLKIDPTKASSVYREGLSKLIGLKATIARLQAEAFQHPLEFPEDVKGHPEVVTEERLAYEARAKALNDGIDALERSYTLAAREIAMAQPLSAKGLISQVELLRMRRQANDLRAQIVERKNKFQADANAELTKLALELAQTKENLVGREDVMERTTVVAPVKGTVKNIRVTTIGGVIQPGQHIMEIVPLGDQLLVEAKVKPSDVAFLRPALPATVKISAYDYSIYGGLKGVVELISPDTLKEEERTAAAKQDESYYKVIVRADKSFLEAGGRQLPIIPGMTATVEIRTGEKTILAYLLKPVLKAREAFRER
jgi:adhesin transport system membrane fusion protein